MLRLLLALLLVAVLVGAAAAQQQTQVTAGTVTIKYLKAFQPNEFMASYSVMIEYDGSVSARDSSRVEIVGYTFVNADTFSGKPVVIGELDSGPYGMGNQLFMVNPYGYTPTNHHHRCIALFMENWGWAVNDMVTFSWVAIGAD